MCGPNIGFLEIKQGWNDVFDFTENTVCDICGKLNKVKTGQIPMLTCAVGRAVNIGHASWRLCQSCHIDKGWQPPSEYYHGMMYYNSKTKKPKFVH